MKVQGLRDTIEWYDNNAKSYADKSQNISEKDKEGINEFVALLGQTDKVLDAGCGAGIYCVELKKLGLQVNGIDLSSGLVMEAKNRYPDIDFKEGSFLELPYESSSFDGVWSHASIVHLENESDVFKALSEFKRVLKKTGYLHLHARAQLTEVESEVVSDSLSAHDRFFRYYRREELCEYLENIGFRIIKSYQYPDSRGRPGIEWFVILAQKIVD